jgi:hypothetical protein
LSEIADNVLSPAQMIPKASAHIFGYKPEFAVFITHGADLVMLEIE